MIREDHDPGATVIDASALAAVGFGEPDSKAVLTAEPALALSGTARYDAKGPNRRQECRHARRPLDR